MTERAELIKIHGDGNCHICGAPKIAPGSSICSYPHGMVPKEEISYGMWSWAHAYGEAKDKP